MGGNNENITKHRQIDFQYNFGLYFRYAPVADRREI